MLHLKALLWHNNYSNKLKKNHCGFSLEKMQKPQDSHGEHQANHTRVGKRLHAQSRKKRQKYEASVCDIK